MTKKLDSKFWAKYFKVYDVLNMVIPYQELLDTIVKEAKIKKGDLVLDAGCGTGNLSIKCKKAGAKVIGIDYCAEALDRYKEKDPKAEVSVHDLTKPLPFPSNHFDKVVCNNVIYSLDKKVRPNVIKEFHRVLKKGGRCVVVNPLFGFKMVAIYKSHIQKSIHRSGFFETAKKVVFLVPSTIRMVLYNRTINQHYGGSAGGFAEEKKQNILFRHSNFNFIKSLFVYENQSSLVALEK